MRSRALSLVCTALFFSLYAVQVIADDIQVNTYTSANQYRPATSMDDDGDFVIVWTSDGSAGTDSSAESIQGRRFTSDGSPLSGEFQINTFTSSYQRDPSVSHGPGGDFVVVWESDGSAGTDTSRSSIQGRRFSSDGSTIGGEFQINTLTAYFQRRPQIEHFPNGDFIVLWDSSSQSSAIQGRRYASGGAPIGDQFAVNTYTTGGQFTPQVAIGGNGVAWISWESFGSPDSDQSGSSILARRLNSDGSFIGNDFQVNSFTTSYQLFADVAADDDGDVIFVWSSYVSPSTDSSSNSVLSRRFSSDERCSERLGHRQLSGSLDGDLVDLLGNDRILVHGRGFGRHYRDGKP